MAEPEKQEDTVEAWKEKFKNLQRENEKARQRTKEAVIGHSQLEEMKAELIETKGLTAILAESLLTDAEDAAPKVKKVRESADLLRTAAKSYREMAETITDNDLGDWSDPQFNEARRLYEQGRFEDALAAVKKLVPSKSPDEFQAAVEAEVKRRVRGESHVEPGTTQAKEGVPDDPEQLQRRLQDRSPEGIAWRKAHRQELLKRLIGQ